MPTAAQIFDRTYKYGDVSNEARTILRDKFIATIDRFLSMPVTRVFNAFSSSCSKVFVTYSYSISNHEMGSVTCDMLVIKSCGSLERFREELNVPLKAIDHNEALLKLDRRRKSWENRFNDKTIAKYRNNEKKSMLSKRDGYMSGESLSLTPFEKTRFFNYQGNAYLYMALVAPYAHLTKRGSIKKREVGRSVDPERLPRVFLPALTAMAKPFWDFRRKFLRPEILSILASLGLAQLVSYYNWFQANGNELISLRRQQAARAFPVFFEEFFKKEKLTEAIDCGVELIPLLASHFSSPPATIRFLRGKTNQMLGTKYSSIDWFVKEKISPIPIDQMPKRKNEWEFLRGLSTCYIQSALKTGFPSLVKLSHRRSLDGHSFARLIQDYHSALGGRLDESALLRIYSSVAFKKWAEVSDRFHSLRQTLAAQFSHKVVAARRSANMIDTWEPICDDMLIGPNSVSISFLTSIDALESEAKVMHHCVDGYGEHCLFYGSHIASLLLVDGIKESRSTAELKFYGDKLEIEQHFAVGNTLPHEALSKALDSFVSRVNSRRIDIDRQRLESAHEERMVSKDSYREQMKIVDAERRLAFQQLARDLLPPAAKRIFAESLADRERKEATRTSTISTIRTVRN